MRNPTHARINTFAAVVMATASLSFAGCGGASSTKSSPSTTVAASPLTTVASPASTTATSPPATSTAEASGAAQLNAKAVSLLGTYFVAGARYDASCCRGTDYDAEARAVRAFQAASNTFIDGIDRFIPPPSVAVALHGYIASIRADVAQNGKILTAVLARDWAAIRAAVHADEVVVSGLNARFDVWLGALGDRSSDVVGLWVGRVTQHGPGTTKLSYDVEMTVTGKGPRASAGTISYPSLKCAGELQLLSAPGIFQVYRERITVGRKQCSTGATIFATVLGNYMSWRWVATGINVVGVLGHPQQPGE